MACDTCDWPYPDELLNRMFVGQNYTKPICGICALALSNKIHGEHRTAFHGEMAENFRQRAMAWRQRHPKANPNKKP